MVRVTLWHGVDWMIELTPPAIRTRWGRGRTVSQPVSALWRGAAVSPWTTPTPTPNPANGTLYNSCTFFCLFLGCFVCFCSLFCLFLQPRPLSDRRPCPFCCLQVRGCVSEDGSGVSLLPFLGHLGRGQAQQQGRYPYWTQSCRYSLMPPVDVSDASRAALFSAVPWDDAVRAETCHCKRHDLSQLQVS